MPSPSTNRLPRSLAVLTVTAALLGTVGSRAATPLANGALVSSLPAEASTSAALSLAAGSADDPAGQEGLAELTARTVTAASQAHRAEGDLVTLLASSVGGAGLEVDAGTTTFTLSDVSDLGTALSLMTEALARPSFPVPALLAARRSLHLEALDALAGDAVSRRIDAESALLGSASAWDRAWSIPGLDLEDVRAFHAAHYRASRLHVAMTGSSAPDLAIPDEEGAAALADLPAPLGHGVGAWQAGAAEEATAPTPRAATGKHLRLLTSAAESGVSLAFPATDDASLLALLAAADASGRDSWTIVGPGRGTIGALRPAPGELVLAECTTPSPASAARALLAALTRLGDRPPSAAAWTRLVDPARHPASAVGDRAVDFLDCPESAALSDCSPAALLARATPESVRAAAAALAAGPRSVVGSASDEAAAKAWMRTFPTSTSRPASEPGDATGRARVAEARAWVAAAVEAHGGDRLRSLTGWTRLSDESAAMEDQPKLLGALRLDTSLEPVTTRHEFRHVVAQIGTRLVTLSDWSIERRDGGPTLESVEACAVRNQLLRQPLLLLLRAASGRLPMRSEGVDVADGRRLRHVSISDPDAGLTRLSFDDRSGQLVAARFRQRIKAAIPARDVSLSWSDLREINGVIVPFRETLRAGASGMSQVSVSTSWILRRQPFAPLRITTSADDLAIERLAN